MVQSLQEKNYKSTLRKRWLKAGITRYFLKENRRIEIFNKKYYSKGQLRSCREDFDSGVNLGPNFILFECQICFKKWTLNQQQVDLGVGDFLGVAHKLYHRALEQEASCILQPKEKKHGQR